MINRLLMFDGRILHGADAINERNLDIKIEDRLF